jgi:hypothetical protein
MHRREIEDMVLLALKQPEVYDTIARGTRRKFESNRPRAILFEGPPGKESCETKSLFEESPNNPPLQTFALKNAGAA